MDLNQRVLQSINRLDLWIEDGIIGRRETTDGATIYDFGIRAPGGLQAGLTMAELIMAEMARVTWAPIHSLAGGPDFGSEILIQVHTDAPLMACMAAQYAGWPVQAGDYFAMGSGPMRAIRGKEKVLLDYDLTFDSTVAVGALETDQFPTDEAIDVIADDCGLEPDSLILLVAPVTSIAGSVQVVARSVETALHKLHELGFDLRNVVSGAGAAPLCPPAVDTMEGIGRTNDAILYGGEVTLWVDCEDEVIQEIGRQVPSSQSAAYGKPFMEIFHDHDRDFYKIDPMLFSPAVIRFVNLQTGKTVRFGDVNLDVLRQSFSDGEQ